MGTLAGCAVTTIVLFVYYLWENKKRGVSEQTEDDYLSPEAWAGMTDKENKNFRYTY